MDIRLYFVTLKFPRARIPKRCRAIGKEARYLDCISPWFENHLDVSLGEKRREASVFYVLSIAKRWHIRQGTLRVHLRARLIAERWEGKER